MKKLMMATLATLAFTVTAFAEISIQEEGAPPTPPPAEKSKDQYISYHFGDVPVNSQRSIAYSIKNTGDQPLKIEKITYSGASFRANSNCPDVLEAGKVCRTAIYFWPAFEGLYSGRVVWYTSDNNIILDLWGNGSRY